MFCSTRWAGNSFMHLAAEIWHNSVKKCNKSTNRSLEVYWIDGILGIHLHNWHVRVCALLIAVRVPLIWMPLSHWSVVYFILFSISAARYDCARIRIAVICRPHKFLFLYVCVCVWWHSRWRQACMDAFTNIEFEFSWQTLPSTGSLYFFSLKSYSYQ